MTSAAKLEAAFKAVTPVVDKAIANAEAGIPSPFMRRQADQAVHEHRAQIDASVKEICEIAIDAAAKTPD